MPPFNSPFLSLRSHEALPSGIRRIIRQQIETTLKLIPSSDFDPELVHGVRKCARKLMAMLRLISREVGKGSFRLQNRYLREARRTLSLIRDAETLIEAYHHLIQHSGVDPAHHPELYGKLLEERKCLYLRVNEHFSVIEEAVLRLQEALPSWELGSICMEDLLKTIMRTYRRGREAIQVYVKTPDDEGLHTVRKRTKDVWYQLRIMQERLSPSADALVTQCGEVSELAGLARDYGMLAAFTREHASGDSDRLLGERLLGLEKSFADAAKRQFILFYKESPSHFLARIRPTSGPVRRRAIVSPSPIPTYLSSQLSKTPKGKKSRFGRKPNES